MPGHAPSGTETDTYTYAVVTLALRDQSRSTGLERGMPVKQRQNTAMQNGGWRTSAQVMRFQRALIGRVPYIARASVFVGFCAGQEILIVDSVPKSPLLSLEVYLQCVLVSLRLPFSSSRLRLFLWNRRGHQPFGICECLFCQRQHCETPLTREGRNFQKQRAKGCSTLCGEGVGEWGPPQIAIDTVGGAYP